MSILKVGDRVIIIERGPDFGKMCDVIEAPQTNELLAVRIELVNPHDHFRSGDIFSVTAEAVTPINGTAPAAAQLVELQASTKLKLVTEATSQSTQVGTVIGVEGDYIVIKVS